MDIKEKEQYAKELIKICGYSSKNTESRLYALLYHQYAAIALYETASAADRSAVDAVAKRLKSLISIKFKLKERGGRKKEKQENTPTPPKEKIEKKEVPDKKKQKNEEQIYSSDFKKRELAFRQECDTFIGKYPSDCVMDFFLYWSDDGRHSGKMRFECERFWNIEKRLARWSKNHVYADNCAANLRLQKAKEAQGEKAASVAKQQMVAEIRQAADEQREREQEQSKQNQELTDDYLKRNPNGLLARFARERERKERLRK